MVDFLVTIIRVLRVKLPCKVLNSIFVLSICIFPVSGYLEAGRGEIILHGFKLCWSFFYRYGHYIIFHLKKYVFLGSFFKVGVVILENES